jgi:hypothetical protein
MAVSSTASDKRYQRLGVAVIVVGVVGGGALAFGPQFAEQDKRNKMRDVCTAAVSEWAGVSESELEWEDVSAENFSDAAWDFRGSYPGGTWACGGPAGETAPSDVVVYTADGLGENITP